MLEERVSAFVKKCFWGVVMGVAWVGLIVLPFAMLAGFIWVGVTVARSMGVAI